MADSLFDNRYRYDYIYPRGRSGETLRAVDTEAEGGEESGIALISEHFEESESADDSLEDYEDDDFYDTYEGYDDDYGGGGDSGF